MELTLHVLCAPSIATGFALAGVEVDEVADGQACARRLRTLAADPAVGMVLVEASLHAALPEDFRQRLERLARPIVMPFPGPRWDLRSEAEAYVLGILRRAIGYRVRAR